MFVSSKKSSRLYLTIARIQHDCDPVRKVFFLNLISVEDDIPAIYVRLFDERMTLNSKIVLVVSAECETQENIFFFEKSLIRIVFIKRDLSQTSVSSTANQFNITL